MPTDENDWLFDFVFQFLESEKFEAGIMDFIDEKCEHFDNEEENKFIYTDIHSEFCEHVEALISSNLGELGASSDQFLDACEQGRSSRDINSQVFERILAMEDFQTFKKIMVKRNLQLQLEAIRALSSEHLNDLADTNDFTTLQESEAISAATLESEKIPNPDDLEAMKLAQLEHLEDQNINEDEMHAILHSGLMEMELIRKGEEIEQLELEKAIAISLAMEEERLKRLQLEAKRSDDEPTPSADCKSSEAETAGSKGSKDTREASTKDDVSSPVKTIRPTPSTSPTLTVPDPKPLKSMSLKPLGAIGSRPLPPIGGGDLTRISNDLDERRRQAEQSLKANQKQLAAQKQKEDELRKELQVDPALEAEIRAKHMREQREKILAKKKAEREEKVRIEEESKGKASSESDAKSSSPSAPLSPQRDTKGVAEDMAEQRRAAMRMALARRMKMELIESEEQRLAQLQEEQFADLDRKLIQVEQLRHENRQREVILAEQLRKQQATILRNMKKSAAELND